MSDKVLPGQPPIELVLRRSTRAKRLSLRVSQLDGRVTLTMPYRCNEAEALAFAEEKESWIRKHLAERSPEVAIGHGETLPFAGIPHRIVPGIGRSVKRADGLLYVPGAARQVGPRVAGYLKAQARLVLAETSKRYAERLGKPYAAITCRDTRSRWGSCTAQGRLMYSWRLIMAPPEVLDYVAAHEVAHLAEMNHSPAFWQTVESLYGDYKTPRRWLRTQGSSLHMYRFK